MRSVIEILQALPYDPAAHGDAPWVTHGGAGANWTSDEYLRLRAWAKSLNDTEDVLVERLLERIKALASEASMAGFNPDAASANQRSEGGKIAYQIVIELSHLEKAIDALQAKYDALTKPVGEVEKIAENLRNLLSGQFYDDMTAILTALRENREAWEELASMAVRTSASGREPFTGFRIADECGRRGDVSVRTHPLAYAKLAQAKEGE